MRGAGSIRVFVLPNQALIPAFAAAPYGSENYYAFFDEHIFPAIIGKTVHLPISPWDQILPFLMGLIFVSVLIGVVWAFWKRNHR